MLSYFVLFVIIGFLLGLLGLRGQVVVIGILLGGLLWGVSKGALWGLVSVGELFIGYSLSKLIR
jgi:hypothetical protein